MTNKDEKESNIVNLPKSNESKARLNKLFDANLLKYDLNKKEFYWAADVNRTDTTAGGSIDNLN